MAKSSEPVSVVTGGAGFLGSHLIERLLAEGHRVIAIDNLITGNTREHRPSRWEREVPLRQTQRLELHLRSRN